MYRGNRPSISFSPSVIDRIVSYFSPVQGLKRLRSRMTMSAMEEYGYIVPGSSRRATRGWNPMSRTADQDTISKLERSRAGVRDLAMNSPIARGALQREKTNVVGWGLKLQSRIDRELLGISDKEADAWERRTEKEFQLWSTSVECDMERTSNFAQLQVLALYNTSLSGDVFFLLPYKRRGEFPYELKVQLIEADMVANPSGQMDTVRLAGGIEVDDVGAPIRYYFRKIPQDYALSSCTLGALDTFAVEAYSPSGRRNVYHLFHKERPGQRRGMPLLAPVVEVLKQITRLTEAELMASVISAFFTVFVKTAPAYGGLTEGFVPEEKVTKPETNPTDENIYEMGSGNVIELGGEGQDISIADPKRPNGAFEPFFLALVKQIGSAIEIPFEQLMLYFSASYSAARGAILEAWKFYRHRRAWLASNFCQPIYSAFLEEAIVKGRIQAPGFFDDPLIRQAWSGAVWSGPGQGQLNPLQETQAADLKIQRYLSTYETEYGAIHGDDWGAAIDRNARELAMLRDRELPIPQPKSILSGGAAAEPNESAEPTAKPTTPEGPEQPDEDDEE